MSIFFYSDPHFFHEKIIGFCNRPWKTAEEMNSGLVTLWNETVRPIDDVYVLGDMFFDSTPETRRDVMSLLNGRVHLVRGNHDHSERIKDLPFEWVKDYHELKWNHHKICLSHYPHISWDGDRRGSWLLHGHCHGSKLIYPMSQRTCDVGMDAVIGSFPKTYKPRPIEMIEMYMKDRPVRTEGGF